MRVLYHHRTQGRGAEGVHITSVVSVLESLGFKVDILSPPGVDPRAEAGSYLYQKAPSSERGSIRWLWRFLSRHAPQIVFEFAELCYNFWALARLYRHSRRVQTDLMYERHAFFLWAGAFFARRKRYSMILEVNEVSGIARARHQILVKLARWIESYVFRSADTVVVVSSFLKETLRERGVNPDKIVVVPNGVDHQRFHPQVNGGQMRQIWGLQGKIIFGFVGWFDPWDDLPLLISTFGEVHRLRPEAALVLVGNAAEGPGLDELRRQIRQEGLKTAVVLAGAVPREQMPSTIASLDVGVIPHSNSFGSPVVLFEFMASGKPVIAPALGPLRDVLQHEENGFLFPPKDRTALKKLLLHLIDNPDIRKQIGVAARKTVLADHAWEVKVKRILAFHKSHPKLRDRHEVRQNVALTGDVQEAVPRSHLSDAPPMNYPFLSIVLPVRNEERFIGDVLEQLFRQDYPVEKLEILVVDGRSDDRTRERVTTFAARYPQLRLLDNPTRLSSGARNVGAMAAKGEFVVYIDGHCRIPDNKLLKNIALAFEKSGAECLGRPQPLIKGGKRIAQAIDLARGSMLGHNPSSYIYSDYEGFIDPTSCGAAYKKEVFQKVGHFDENFDACEDVEFNLRVRKAGLKCYLSPSLKVLYFPRESLCALFRQAFRYGWGRFKLFQKYSSSLSLLAPVPGLYALTLLVLLGAGPWSPLFLKLLLGAILMYTVPVALIACYLSCKNGLSLFPLLIAVFPTIHFGTGFGFWASAFFNWKRKEEQAR